MAADSPFVRLIEQAGIRQYRRKRRYLRIRRPISVEDKGKRISILPDEVSASPAIRIIPRRWAASPSNSK